MLLPHGGRLIDRKAETATRQKLMVTAKNMPCIYLNIDQLIDLDNIASGLYSPLEGFLLKEDYLNVINNMRLTDENVWTIPIILAVTEKEAETLPDKGKVALYFKKDQKLYAILDLQEKYHYDPAIEAKAVYGTIDINHPGVKRVFARKEVLLGGKIIQLNPLKYTNFNQYRFTPAVTRKMIEEKGWKTIVAFQTRNPIHRAHEYLQKCALEIVDGLFLSPLVGKTKPGDIPAEIRIKSYQEVINKLYPPERVMMAVFPAAMYYAGPREAIFHALCRKNYGCTHFIVGRDHAGVGDYYGTYEAQKIFDSFSDGEIGIKPLRFEYAFYCKKCVAMASAKTCPHSRKQHIYLSGTKVRELLNSGKLPPVEMTRPEVAKILVKGMKK